MNISVPHNLIVILLRHLKGAVHALEQILEVKSGT